MKCQVLRSNEVSDNRKKKLSKIKGPLKYFLPQVLGPTYPGLTWIFCGPGSRVPHMHFGVWGPGSRGPTCRRLGFRVLLFGYADMMFEFLASLDEPFFLIFLMSTKNFCGNKKNFWPFGALTSPNDQTHSNSSSANCQQIVWVCLTILWGWRLRS